MSTSARLDSQINKATYLSAIILFVFTAVSMFGVYDAPAGSSAAEKVAWLNENNGAFVLSWVTQIVQVFTLAAVFAATCWKVFSVNPLAAVSAALVLMLGTMAILITKGTELWVVPLAAQDLAAGSSGQEPGHTLLSINSQSYPYSLTTYFDYLGLWLWSLFGLLVARPLFRFSTSAKVAAISLGLFGIIYPIFYGFLVTGVIPLEEITNYSTFMLLAWVGAFAMGIYCRGESRKLTSAV
jgi:membrane-associated HD superfamily phosphohydrolase